MEARTNFTSSEFDSTQESLSIFDRVMTRWLSVGLFFVLAGMFLVTKRTGFTTIVYVFLVLPALVVMLANVKTLWRQFLRVEIIAPLLLVVYLALSSIWAEPSEVGDYIKRALFAILACYGLCYLEKNASEFMRLAMICAIICVAGISLFWMVDFYLLMDNSLSARFMAGQGDYFSLYKQEYYAAFFNPLRLSHVLTFMFFMGIAALYCLSIESRAIKFLLLLSVISIGMLIILAQTRTAWLLCLGAVCLAIFNRWGWKGILGFLALLVVAAFLFLQMDHSVVNRGLSYRPQIWAAGIAKIDGAWFFGHGLGAKMLLDIEGVPYPFAEAHNIYIMMVYYGGLAAIAFWFLSVAVVLVKPVLQHGLTLWLALWGSLFLLGGMTDGAGLLSRPNEHWFTLVIPFAFLYFGVGKDTRPMMKFISSRDSNGIAQNG